MPDRSGGRTPNVGDDRAKGISEYAVLYPLEYATMSGGEKVRGGEGGVVAEEGTAAGAVVSVDDDDPPPPPPAATDESSREDDDVLLRGRMGRRRGDDGSRRLLWCPSRGERSSDSDGATTSARWGRSSISSLAYLV